MTDQELKILAQERKKIKGFLAALREHNETINEHLAEMIRKIAKIREAYLGIKMTIDLFEEKLGK